MGKKKAPRRVPFEELNFAVVRQHKKTVNARGVMKKKVPFWGKLCACFACAAVALSVMGDCVIQMRASGETTIASLEAKAKKLKEENDKRQQQIAALDSNINDNKETMNLVSDQIDGVIEEINTFSNLITAKQEDIDQKLIDITNVEASIEHKEEEIYQKQIKIAELQEENRINLEKFGKLARYMYMNNASSQLPVLNGSNDWYDYFVYSDVVKNISGQNYEFMQSLLASIADQEEMIRDLTRSIETLETEKRELQQQKTDYEAEAAQLEQEKKDLEYDANQKRSYLNGLAAENETLKSKIDGLEDEIAEANAEREKLNAQIEELIRQAQQGNGGYDYSGDGLRWPLAPNFKYITTYFGYDAWRAGMHRGIDVGNAGIKGAPIYAAQSGKVISVINYCTHNVGKNWSCGCGGGYGNYIIIDHGGGLSTVYAHCQAIYVSQGQYVNKGDTIGEVGTTGWSTGFHLHFETRENGVAVNPFNYVS
ncbi:MAG: peptidoglycan DD-metalloendopeptidase family protein [Oscillospiraceae bacterium]|nr:peptidoglycan DD-metalloendopeptidase family protein [Oscillospiraceae bacterium]